MGNSSIAILASRTIVKQPRLARYFKHATLLHIPPSWGTFWERSDARDLGLTVAELECLEKIISRKHQFWMPASNCMGTNATPTLVWNPTCRVDRASVNKGRLNTYAWITCKHWTSGYENLRHSTLLFFESSTVLRAKVSAKVFRM